MTSYFFLHFMYFVKLKFVPCNVLGKNFMCGKRLFVYWYIRKAHSCIWEAQQSSVEHLQSADIDRKSVFFVCFAFKVCILHVFYVNSDINLYPRPYCPCDWVSRPPAYRLSNLQQLANLFIDTTLWLWKYYYSFTTKHIFFSRILRTSA